MRAAAVVAVLLAVSGCAAPPPAACPTEPCTPAPSSLSPSLITRPPGVDLPPVPANETLRTLRLENCTAFAGGIDVPRERVDPFVPDDFERFSRVPNTWFVVFSALHCGRAVLAGDIHENHMEFHVAPRVVPRNSSWHDTPAASFFLLDHYFSIPSVAEAFSSWGFPSRHAEVQVAATGPITAWQVTAGAESFAFEYPRSSQPTNPLNFTNYHWSGGGPYIRAKLELAVTGDLLETAGALRMEGRSQTAELLGSPVAQWTGGAMNRVELIEVIEPTLYGSIAT